MSKKYIGLESQFVFEGVKWSRICYVKRGKTCFINYSSPNPMRVGDGKPTAVLLVSGLGCVFKGMTMKKFLFATLLLASSVSHAALLGETVHIAQNYNEIGEEHYPTDSVVGTGYEFVWSGVYSVDVSDSSIQIDFGNISFVDNPETGGYFNGPIISWVHDFTLTGFSNFFTSSLFSSSDIHYGANWIGFDIEGLSFTNGDIISVDLVSEVPVPAAAFLFGPALLGFLGMRRRAKKLV